MLKKAAALLLVCASMATWLGCGTTSNHYVYAAIPASNEIVAYREDPNSGVLTQLVGSPITAGLAVQDIVMHPSGKFMYTANSGEDDISLYTIASSGSLTEVTPRTSVGIAPTVIAMDPSGSYLYVANSGSFNISVFSISTSSSTLGHLTPVGAPFPIGMSPINMAVSPSGILYVTGGGSPQGVIEAFSFNAGTPTPVTGSPFLTGSNPYGLAITSNGGFLYTGNNIDNSISEFSIGSSGNLAQLSNSPFGEQYAGPVALLIDKSGKYLYVANQASSNLAGYGIGSDGSLTLLASSPFGTAASPGVIATDPGGNYLFVGNQKAPVIQSFNLAASSGTLTSVTSYSVPQTITSIAVTP